MLACLLHIPLLAHPRAKSDSGSAAFFERIGIGFEESGLLLRIRAFSLDNKPLKPRLLTLGGAFRWINQQDFLHQDLYEWHAKIGLIRELTRNPRARPGLFCEAMVKMKQFEEGPLAWQTRYAVYDVWGFKGRFGAIISMYPAPRLCISFRLGIELGYYTPVYVPNMSNTKLAPLGDGSWVFGLCGYETNPLEMFVNNLGIHVTF